MAGDVGSVTELHDIVPFRRDAAAVFICFGDIHIIVSHTGNERPKIFNDAFIVGGITLTSCLIAHDDTAISCTVLVVVVAAIVSVFLLYGRTFETTIRKYRLSEPERHLVYDELVEYRFFTDNHLVRLHDATTRAIFIYGRAGSADVSLAEIVRSELIFCDNFSAGLNIPLRGNVALRIDVLTGCDALLRLDVTSGLYVFFDRQASGGIHVPGSEIQCFASAFRVKVLHSTERGENVIVGRGRIVVFTDNVDTYAGYDADPLRVLIFLDVGFDASQAGIDRIVADGVGGFVWIDKFLFISLNTRTSTNGAEPIAYELYFLPQVVVFIVYLTINRVGGAFINIRIATVFLGPCFTVFQ